LDLHGSCVFFMKNLEKMERMVRNFRENEP
jgi:hypothetical protein